MAAFLSGLWRNWTILSPPVATKETDALKFGILGAANIAPIALIIPAKSHPEVVIHAVAARDKARAKAFATKHRIPVVKDSYDAILDDPAIDVVYIPLPNGLHYEWTVKALAKGKHVLLEKPSANNLQEATSLFQHPLLSQSTNPPVLMEAFHSCFSPSWRLFLSTLDPPNITHVLARAVLPSFAVSDDDIRFDYTIGGGALLDLGTYPVAVVRAAFAAEPVECLDADLPAMAPPRDRCDHTFRAKFQFPNGGVGEVDGSLRGSNFRLELPVATVTHRPVPAAPEEEGAVEGTKATRTRKVVFWNFLMSPHYHRIDMEDKFEVKQGEKVVKEFTRVEYKKAYTFKEMGWDQPSETYWSTYRHMLNQFVHKVKGREGTGVFVSHEHSIAQARALDMIYNKSGLGTRPSMEYALDHT